MSARLQLRPARLDEAARIASLLGHWEIIRWMAVVPWPYGVQDARDFINQCRTENAIGPVSHFAITERHSSQLMGHIDLRHGTAPDAMELGYWLGLPFWGRGYMSEAIAAVVAYGFGRLGLRRITAVTHIENGPSRRALEKAGFAYLGLKPIPFRPNRLRGSDFVHAYEQEKEKT